MRFRTTEPKKKSNVLKTACYLWHWALIFTDFPSGQK